MAEDNVKKRRRSPGAPNIRLVVTKAIIDTSVPQNSSHCMLAEALKQTYPKGTSIAVDLQTIRVSNPEKRQRYTYLTPRLAQVALIQFDQGITPEPFEVSLRNGQVTNMATSAVARAAARAGRVISVKTTAALEKAAASNPLKQASLVIRRKESGMVPDRIGGKTPPIQKTDDGVPFSKRRSFGLRAMKM